jgi:hypothetical protein
MAVLGSTSLTGCNSIPDFIAGGSLMLFQQSTAPTNWTKGTTHDNKALRVVTGTATPGGSTAFTSVFASRTPAGSVSVSGGSVGNHTLASGQIPNHTHTNGASYPGPLAAGASSFPTPQYTPPALRGVQPSSTGGVNEGSDQAHSHPFSVGSASFSGSAMDFAVQYVDIIICSKN